MYVCHVCCNLDSNWRKSKSINTNEVTSFSVAIRMKQTKMLTFSLRITGASSRNVGKFYQIVNLFVKNLRLFRSILNLILLVALEYRFLQHGRIGSLKWTSNFRFHLTWSLAKSQHAHPKPHPPITHQIFCWSALKQYYNVHYLQGCHNLLTINPKEHTPNPEIVMENTVPYGSRRLKHLNIPNLHMLTNQNWCLKIILG